MKEKILILGGTEFVGRQLVDVLRKDKTKEVYLFNRGKTNSHLFPEVSRIIGDRESEDIEKINIHAWDYVIDFSSYFPHSLQKTLDQLQDSVKKYIYISTISVYDMEGYEAGTPIAEDFPKLTCSAAEAIDKSMRTYGQKKVACEAVLDKADWLNSIILRPSIIYGKYDPTDRFYYWLRKVKMGQEIILPNQGQDTLTLTYAEDLVQILLAALADKLPNGAYNCGTHDPIRFGTMLDWMKEILNSPCKFFPLDYQKLRAEKRGLPLAFIRNWKVNSQKIKRATGIEFLPFRKSLEDLITHFEKGDWRPVSVGLPDDLEKELINKFQ